MHHTWPHPVAATILPTLIKPMRLVMYVAGGYLTVVGMVKIFASFPDPFGRLFGVLAVGVGSVLTAQHAFRVLDQARLAALAAETKSFDEVCANANPIAAPPN